MDCTEVLGRLSDFLDGELEDCGCSEIEQHIATCASCAEVKEGLQASIDLCRQYLPQERPRELPAHVRQELAQVYERLTRKRQ